MNQELYAVKERGSQEILAYFVSERDAEEWCDSQRLPCYVEPVEICDEPKYWEDEEV